jgi:nicotinamide phosphoribosyltransferase
MMLSRSASNVHGPNGREFPNPFPPSDKNPGLISDSYKLTHEYDGNGETLVGTYAHITPRVGKSGPDKVVAVGQMHIASFMASLVVKPENLPEIKDFCDAHFGPGVYRGAMWEKIVADGGKIPMRIKAVPEGTVVPRGTAIMIIESTSVPEAVPFFEAQLQRIWYPTSVATRATEYRTIVKKWLDNTVNRDLIPLIFSSRVHDFGARATTAEGAAEVGGMAAIEAGVGGSDTVAGVVHVMKLMPDIDPATGKAKMPAFSVRAGEHNVAMSRGEDGEMIPFEIALEKAPTGLLSWPIDTYGTLAFVDKVTQPGALRDRLMARAAYGASQGVLTFTVLRPDSPVLAADGSKMSHAQTLCAIFARIRANLADLTPETGGLTVNSLGYSVLPSWLKVIYGDSVTTEDVEDIYSQLAANGWSAENLVFGVGGNLLQNGVTRGWLDFAMKCSQQTYRNDATGELVVRNVGKKTPGKVSPVGRQKVITRDGVVMMVPEGDGPELDMMVVYYEDGRLYNFEPLQTVRDRVTAGVGF